MDNALMKKVTQYPEVAGELGQIQSPNFTQSTVISADISVFHQTDSPGFQDAEELSEIEPEQDYEAGLRDGKAQSDLVYLNTISVMQNALDELQAKIGVISNDIEAKYLSAISLCLKTAVPGLVKTGTATEVQNMIAETAKMSLSTDLEFRVHPDSVEDCERLCELNGKTIEVTSDANLAPSQVQLHWQNGGVNLNSDEIFQAFMQRLELLLESLNAKNTTE